MKITCKGVLLWWSNSFEEDEEPLHATLEHLSFNMLFLTAHKCTRTQIFPGSS